jgi:hypothetical protein
MSRRIVKPVGGLGRRGLHRQPASRRSPPPAETSPPEHGRDGERRRVAARLRQLHIYINHAVFTAFIIYSRGYNKMTSMSAFLALSASLAPSLAAVNRPPCSLNGALIDGVCMCDKPWSGHDCSTLNFHPVAFPQGYGMAPNLTSWGGNTIRDASTGKYHMYVSAMTNGCPLSTWRSNSRVEHAVSDTITGPYHFVDVAVPTWSHNAAPISLKDGTYAIVHIGTGVGPPSGGQNCSHSSPFVPASAEEKGTAGSTIHVAKSLEGPWEPLVPNTLGDCNNPAPWVHRNGTLYIVCGLSMKRADSISGPWSTVSSFVHEGGPAGNYEGWS